MKEVNEATDYAENAPYAAPEDALEVRICEKYGGTHDGSTCLISMQLQLAMREEMTRDERVFILGEDVGNKGGVFKATNGLYDEFGEDRVFDTPLAESAIAGVGIGAAMYGLRPIAEMQFADFIMPAVNQIISEAVTNSLSFQ